MRGSAVLGIPRRGWRGFESPAKFKLLAMEGGRCLGGLGRWVLLDVCVCSHSDRGWGDAHNRDNLLPRLPNRNASKGLRAFRNLGWGLPHGVSSQWGTHTHRAGLLLSAPGNLMYFTSELCQRTLELVSRIRLPQCPEARLLSRYGVLNSL